MICSTDITGFKRNVKTLVQDTIRTNGRVRITTDEGNAVVLSEREYMSIVDFNNSQRPINDINNQSFIDW